MRSTSNLALAAILGCALTLIVYRTFWDTFFILQFGGVAPISSNYFVDLNHLGNEVLLVGDDSSRIVSGGNMKPEFFEFSQKHKTHVDTACGLQIWTGINSKQWKLVHDGKAYLYFVDVDDSVSRRIVNSICKTKKFNPQ